MDGGNSRHLRTLTSCTVASLRTTPGTGLPHFLRPTAPCAAGCWFHLRHACRRRLHQC